MCCKEFPFWMNKVFLILSYLILPFIIYQERTAHSKNLKIGENIAYEMLKKSIKRIIRFFESFARNKKFEFFGQIKKINFTISQWLGEID